MTAVAINETVTGLGEFGTDIGDFFGNTVTAMAPGFIVLAVVLGVVGIIGGVIYLIRGYINKLGKQ